MSKINRPTVRSLYFRDLILGVCLIASTLALGSFQVMGQTIATAKAPIKRITAKVVDNFVCRTSSDNTVADMPDMTLTFKQAGTAAEEVIVTFVGSWPKPSVGTQAGAFILLEIDGDRVDLTSTNGGTLVHEGTAASVSNGTHGFTFVTEPIPPGMHTAKIRWYDNFLAGTGTICVSERSMVIQHR